MRSSILLAMMTVCLTLDARLAIAESNVVWQDPITGMEFVAVPGGSYKQGCGPWTSDCMSNEKPMRRVTLSPFWLGKTEVTQGQWKRVMGNNPSAYQKGDDYPVQKITWVAMQDFISRLNKLSPSGRFRLPTEAEWEYACRSGGKAVSYGTQAGAIGSSLAQYAGQKSPVPVGQFPANALGLYDMSGNVAEFTQDLFSYGGTGYTKGDATNPVEETKGAMKIYRGGAFYSSPRAVRCTDRRGYFFNRPADHIGFRLAREK